MRRTPQSRQLPPLRDERSVTLEVSYTRSSSGESRPCIPFEGLLGSAHILPSPVRARSLLLREFPGFPDRVPGPSLHTKRLNTYNGRNFRLTNFRLTKEICSRGYRAAGEAIFAPLVWRFIPDSSRRHKMRSPGVRPWVVVPDPHLSPGAGRGQSPSSREGARTLVCWGTVSHTFGWAWIQPSGWCKNESDLRKLVCLCQGAYNARIGRTTCEQNRTTYVFGDGGGASRG